MIILNKNQSNDIYVTVSDILPREDGEYILSATHTVSNKTTNISMSRENTDTIRYDKFVINEASHSLEKGKYDYIIKDVSGSVAEYGKMEVIAAEATHSVYEKSNNEIKFYEKD